MDNEAGPSKPASLSKRQLQRRSLAAALQDFPREDNDSSANSDLDAEGHVDFVERDIDHMDCDVENEGESEQELGLDQTREIVSQYSDYSTDEEDHNIEDPDSSSDEGSQAEDEASDEEIEVEQPEHSIQDTLCEWANSNSCLTRACITDLLHRLCIYHPELPLDSKTLLGTPRKTEFKMLQNGKYFHYGLKQCLLKCLKSGHKSDFPEIRVDVNIDGLPLFHSSNSEVWPILGRCSNLIDDRPFVIGIFGGENGKPKSLQEYLEDYLHEVSDLETNGLEFGNQRYTVKIHKYILDAVARAFIKCVIGHCGHSACERCDQEGDTVGTQVVYSPVVGNPRTDMTFDMQVDVHHHIGVSPLTAVNTRMVTQFVLDPLHLLYLGATKRFFRYLLFKAKTGVRLSARKVDKLSERLDIMAASVPSEFSRKARTFKFFRKFKGTELRCLLLYTGPLLLKRMLPENLYKTFLLLHVAAVILSSKPLLSRRLTWAQQCMEIFVDQCRKIFGPAFVSYNIHSLLHLCSDAEKYGTLEEFSAFPFENCLGQLKRLVRSSSKPLEQLVRRLKERNFVIDNEPVKKNKAKKLLPRIKDGRCMKLVGPSFKLTLKYPNNFFRCSQGVGMAHEFIIEPNGKVTIIADICPEEAASSFYTYPFESRLFGCLLVDGWPNTRARIDSRDVSAKLVAFPTRMSGYLVAPLLHTEH